MKFRGTLLVLTPIALMMGGCSTTHTIHHKIDPIYISMDINLKVQKELDDFFGDLDAAATTISTEDE